MIIDFVEMAGFRGFREPLRIDFSRGFTVISGRNGVGKSTICDAIEFALTGEITKYRVEKSDNESLLDYVWWRGNGEAKEHYVSVGFISEDNERFSLTRSRKDGLTMPIEDLEKRLCIPEIGPLRPLEKLCRTALVRDEWIAAQSLDLKETERFDLVSMALGELGNEDYHQRVQDVVRVAQAEMIRASAEHSEARDELSRALAHQSQLQAQAQRAQDVSPALETISKYLTDLPRDLTGVMELVRAEIGKFQEKIAIFLELQDEFEAIQAEEKEVSSAEFQEQKVILLDDVLEREAAFVDLEAELENAKEKLAVEEENNELVAALIKIIEGGEKHGLHSGHCPLCDAARSEREFLNGLASAKKRAGEFGEKLSLARQGVQKLTSQYEVTFSVLKSKQKKLDLIIEREASVRHRIETLAQAVANYGLELEFSDSSLLERELLRLRSASIDLERSALAIENSRSVARLSSHEDIVKKQRSLSERTGKEFERRKRALDAAKEFDRTIKRTRGEVIDERLAALSPLLSELYQRLRPHADWRSIDYSIRGDVRRFLSLKVGDNLNPQFVFSSGQRRAAGIAFLLSVYLARPWCLLNTLVLDDPVQHVDDYRAVHLVELLAALRRDGHQIICTIEDSSLAGLLTRRLAGAEADSGRRYDLNRIEPGIAKATVTSIDALNTNVIELSASA